MRDKGHVVIAVEIWDCPVDDGDGVHLEDGWRRAAEARALDLWGCRAGHVTLWMVRALEYECRC